MSKYKARIEQERAGAHKAIILYIKRHVFEHGESPLIRDIASHMDVTNNSINNRISQLIELGFLGKLCGKRRGLYLQAKGYKFCDS